MNRSVRTLLPAVVAVLALTSGCGGLGGTGDSGIVTGDGTITVLKAGQRTAPEEVAGKKTLTGQTVSLAQLRGKVVVMNVWGSWCGPCRSEADDLAVAAKELAPKGVVFLGINTRDNSPETALAFVRRHNLPYDSIFDPGGETLTAFHRSVPSFAIPSTVVIDAQGRVAATIIGETTALTLVDVVDEVRQGSAR